MNNPIGRIDVLRVLRIEAHAGRGTEDDPHRFIVYLIDSETGCVLSRTDPYVPAAPTPETKTTT